MGQAEDKKIKQILENLPENERLFRINAGMGWTGEIVNHTGQMMVIRNPRPLRAAPEGWGDLCGWESVLITEDMVGSQIAVFKFVEVKTGKQGLRKMQKRFKDLIEKMGGIFVTARG